MGRVGDRAAAMTTQNLLKIGDVSRLSGVSVRMLRHYDDLGLLRPALVDEFSGYRYYRVDQLPRLHRLLALKEMGFSLAQVACLLDGRLPPETVRTLFEERRSEVEREIQEREARLAQLSAQMEHFDPDLSLAGYSVTLGPVAPVRVAGARTVVRTYWHGGPLFERVRAFLGRRGVVPAGPSVAVYHDPDAREQDVDIEAAYPVAVADAPRLVPANEGVTVYDLPALPLAASVMHRGSMHSLGLAYRAVGCWISANGYRIAGPSRNIHHVGGDTPADHVTGVLWPIEPVTTSGGD